MKHFRKFLCYLLGHRSIILHIHFRETQRVRGHGYTTNTVYECERCGQENKNQWDT